MIYGNPIFYAMNMYDELCFHITVNFYSANIILTLSLTSF